MTFKWVSSVSKLLCLIEIVKIVHLFLKQLSVFCSEHQNIFVFELETLLIEKISTNSVDLILFRCLEEF